MGQIPDDNNSGGASDPNMIIYPTDLISQVAAQIFVQADQALQQHTLAWNKIQLWLHDNDKHGYMAAVLNPHEKRMRDTYNWQMQLATTLFDALDLIQTNENNTQQDFTPREHGKPF